MCASGQDETTWKSSAVHENVWFVWTCGAVYCGTESSRRIMWVRRPLCLGEREQKQRQIVFTSLWCVSARSTGFPSVRTYRSRLESMYCRDSRLAEKSLTQYAERSIDQHLENRSGGSACAEATAHIHQSPRRTK